MNITAKKNQLWNHFVARAYEKNSFPHGLTRTKLLKLKPKAMENPQLWERMAAYGIAGCKPEYMESHDTFAYNRMVDNFWDMMIES